jgi:hypothetical protein
MKIFCLDLFDLIIAICIFSHNNSIPIILTQNRGLAGILEINGSLDQPISNPATQNKESTRVTFSPKNFVSKKT